MKRLMTTAAILGLISVLSGQVMAAGATVAPRSGGISTGDALQSAVARGFYYGATPSLRYPRHHHFHSPYYGYPRYYHRPIIIISPYYYYPYFTPATIITTSPFFCLQHNVGYISRAGMLDHLSGTHKIALATAASVCPEGGEGCVIDGY